MFELFRNSVIEWNRTATDRQKLQHMYAVLLVVVTFIAGIVSLFSSQRSDLLWYVDLALITTASINLVAWSLLKTIILDKLPSPTRPRTNKR